MTAKSAAAISQQEPSKKKRGNPNWQPGTSGNPGGRAKDTFGPMVRDFLIQYDKCEETGKKEQRGKQLIRKLYKMGLTEGNVRAITELLNRGFGLPTQRIEIDEAKTELEVQELARKFGKDAEWVRKRAAEKGIRLVS